MARTPNLDRPSAIVVHNAVTIVVHNAVTMDQVCELIKAEIERTTEFLVERVRWNSDTDQFDVYYLAVPRMRGAPKDGT